MQLATNIFIKFVNWLISLEVISQVDLDQVLEEFNGCSGVIEQEMYISAYEEISRHIANKLSGKELVEFLSSGCKNLVEDIDCQYYFVEAMLDEVAEDKELLLKLINASPEPYKEFLIKRFN